MLIRLNFIVPAIFIILSTLSPLGWSAEIGSPDKIKLRLLWTHQFQFAGYYIAKEKGFYAASGLDVDLIEFDSKIDNVQQVLSGETEFAIGRSAILIDRALGADIVALYAAFQSSPLMLLTKAFTGINGPADLKNHRIMITNDAQKSGELIAMLAQSGLKPGDYIQQNHSFNIEDLIQNKTDAIASYISNEPYTLIQKGIPYNILHPADYGFRMYSDILFTNGKLVKENPQLVEKFYQASIAGWKYAFANIQETVELIFNKYNTQYRTREALLYEGQELKKLAFDSAGSFGTLLSQRLQSMAQVYLITGLINQEPDLQGFIYRPPVQQLDLSYDELEYIQRQQKVTICVQKDWPPYEQMSGKQFKGIVADLVNLIRDKTGISLEFNATDTRQQALTLTRQGICDATTIFQRNRNLNDNILISDSLINITHAYLSREINGDYPSLTSRVAIPYQQLCDYCVNKLLPAKNLIKVDNLNMGIEYLSNNKADSVFASEAHIRYQLANLGISDLYINKDFSIETGLSLGMNQQHAVLLSVVDKAIKLISQKERDRILNQSVVAIPKQGLNHSTYLAIMGFIILVSLIFVYRYYREALRNNILKELSETDQLTGIANRRKIIDVINTYINLSTRYLNKLSLIYFDIDDFKKVNDLFGHEVGDSVLIELAQLVQNNIRKTDLFGRLGGEEFLIVSPESDSDHCKKLIEGLQDKIQQHVFPTRQPITCSFGITEYQTGESCDKFINRADHAMYQAKKTGKNSVVIYR